MRTKRNLYDAYINDSDLIGAHSRLQLAVNLSDWMTDARAVFRHIQSPKMKRVLTIDVLLGFMDSFMIYTELFVLADGGRRVDHHRLCQCGVSLGLTDFLTYHCWFLRISG